MILFKGSSYTSDWAWIDDRRCRVNYNDVAYRANYQYGDLGNTRGGVGSSSQPENYAVDFLSNGFRFAQVVEVLTVELIQSHMQHGQEHHSLICMVEVPMHTKPK